MNFDTQKTPPTQEQIDLHKLAAEVQTAQRHVDTARSLVAADKRERSGSLIARIVDALTTTKPEAALNDAESQLAEVTEKGKAASLAWIIATARQRLAEQPTMAEQHQDQEKKLARVQSRERRVRHWLNLSREADNRLSEAQQACESASTTEFLDAISTNKAISALSYLDTSSAADAIKDASRAVQALVEALPKQAEQSDIDQPDDLLDFMVDLAFDPGFDVLSWFNMTRLNDAARQCEQTADKLRPLLERLNKLSSDAKAKTEKERTALRGIEAPYLEAAAAQVPNVLHVPTPAGFAS